MIIPKNLVSFYHDSDLPNKMKENVSHWISTNPNPILKFLTLKVLKNLFQKILVVKFLMLIKY